jgi:hypothetical protein
MRSARAVAEQVQPADGLVILAHGTKYVTSLAAGTVARLRPRMSAEVIAQGIPTPASMAYDPVRNRLVIPQNAQNAVTFLELDGIGE